jgi:hypothetical protein
VATTQAWLESIGYPPKVGGYWSSGFPFLDASPKGGRHPWSSGIQLPLFQANISELSHFVATIPPEMWTREYQEIHSAVMGGRDENQKMFKPGVEGIVLLFSAGDGTGPVYKFPLYEHFAPLIEPVVAEVRWGGGCERRGVVCWGMDQVPICCLRRAFFRVHNAQSVSFGAAFTVVVLQQNRAVW